MFEEPLGGIQCSASEFQENVQDEFGYTIVEKVYNPINDHLKELLQMEREALEEMGSIQELLNEARSIV